MYGFAVATQMSATALPVDSSALICATMALSTFRLTVTVIPYFALKAAAMFA